MLEAQITQDITRYLQTRRDIWFFKVHGHAMQRVGVPDLLLCCNGTFVALEVKRCKALPLSPIQLQEVLAIDRAGGIAHKVSSVEEVKQILEGVKSHEA